MPSFRVGLTGNIAAGKSSVAGTWERLGARVVDADRLARRAVEPGSAGLRRVVEAFGAEVLDGEGRLDREAMRRRVFRDLEARRRLEAIVHPEVARLREEEERALEQAGARVVVHDLPLLFEVGLEDRFDMVVLVDAPAEERLRRLIENRGLAESDARSMIEAQLPADAKRPRADLVIENDGSLATLEARAEVAWTEIQTRAAACG